MVSIEALNLSTYFCKNIFERFFNKLKTFQKQKNKVEKNIAKSSEVLEKEEKLLALQALLQKRKLALRNVQHRLENTKKGIQKVQQDIQNALSSQMDKLNELREEIIGLSKELAENGYFGKVHQEAINRITHRILKGTTYGQKSENEPITAKRKDSFEAFEVSPEAKEQRNIRQVFIKLSKKFHPDLAENEAEEQDFHVIMQQINEAYKANDIQTLLEIEEAYLVEILDFSSQIITVDVLQKEIDRLERDIQFIDNQNDRLNTELKRLQKTDLGAMFLDKRKVEREGRGIKAMKATLQGMIDIVERLKTGFTDTKARGSISPKMLDLINLFANSDKKRNKLYGEIDYENDDISALFGEPEKDDKLEGQRFPIGSSVRVKKPISHYLHRETKMKDWVGTVRKAEYNKKGKLVYTVYFDSETMAKMPKLLIELAEKQDEHFQKYDFLESHLEATAARDTVKDRITANRAILIDTQWQHLLETDDLELLKSILLANPMLNNEENWYVYLEKNLPFNAKSKGEYGLKKNTEIEVKSIAGLSPEVGFIMTIRLGKKRRLEEYPLIDLIPTKPNLLQDAVRLHEFWVENEIK